MEGRRLLATFTVTSTADDGGPAELRSVIAEANATPGANTIEFDPTVFSTLKTIKLAGSELALSNTSGTQTITGPAAGVNISAGGLSRVLQVDGEVTASITGLTFSGGKLGQGGGDGGGLLNNGTVILTGCTIKGNTIDYFQSGAGLANDGGTANLTDCTISGNSNGDGGGVSNSSGTMILTDCTISSNSAHYGGGLWNHLGTLTLTGCPISSNIASGFDGAGGGGLSDDAALTLTDCTISGNTVYGGGGGGVQSGGAATVTVKDCTISDNFTAHYGGGFLSVGTANLTGCTVSGNSADKGGGMFLSGTSKATNITDCTISDNSASVGGGGLFVNTTATLKDSTINDNSATNGGGVDNHWLTNLSDCTISGNSATNGGGVYGIGGLYNSYKVNLTACTVSGNSATNGGGLENNGPASLTDTIVAGNTLPGSMIPSDIVGNQKVSGSYNLLGTGGQGGLTNGVNGNIFLPNPSDLGLAPLGFYGGPTQTMALLPGSWAIGKGTAVNGVTTDQRGEPLDVPMPDIGAFQSQPELVVNTTSDSSYGIDSPPGELSLRQAVGLADFLGGPQTITFDPTVFATAETIVLTQGDLELSDSGGTLTIDGPKGGLTVSGGGAGRVFVIDHGTTAVISGLTITGGSASTDGGGVYNVGTATLTGCTISGNSAKGKGGGLGGDGTTTLSDCTISGNSASAGGGLVVSGTASLTDCTVSGNSSAAGAGLFLDGPATLTASTVSGNTGGDGIENTGTLNLVDSTIAGNAARGLNNQFGQVTLIACTVTGNGGYGLANYRSGSSGAIALTDTIVAGNTLNGSPADIGGGDPADVTGSSNLVGTGGSGGLATTQHNLLGVAKPGLSPLGQYGGGEPTVGLLPGSAAIGAGVATADPQGHAITTDERGLPLDVPSPDIGAFQSQGFSLAAIAGSTPQSAEVGKVFASPLGVNVTAKNAGDPVAGGVITFAVTPNANGASATLSASTAVIGSNGAAQVGATANSTAGSYTVTASAAGAASPVTFSLSNVIPLAYSGLGNPSISYGSTATFSGTLSSSAGQAPVSQTLQISVGGVSQPATIGSGGTFSVTLDTSHLSVSGSPYTVTYAYTSDGTYASANTTGKLTVTKAPPSITWSNPADISYGTALSGTQLDASSLVQGSFAYMPAAGTILHAGAGQTLSVTFTPTDTTDYSTVNATAMINVAQATPKINWLNPAGITYGTALGAAQLDATASVQGTFAYTPAAGTVLKAGPSQTLSVTFTPTDAADYKGATATAMINVAKATPKINWPSPADITYGTTLSGAQLDATASVQGTFAYTPASGTVLKAGSGQTLSVSFSPADPADYDTASATSTINVLKATPTISWTNLTDITYGTTLGPAQLDATASVPGTFAYNPAAGTILKAGSNQPLLATFTPADPADYNGATATVTINVAKAVPAVTWPDPADITYGTALGPAQLDATASWSVGGTNQAVGGTFIYTPAAGTVLKAGLGQTLSVTFTPTDAADYKGAAATATINVLKATPTITWPKPADIKYGIPLSSAQLDATASWPVGGTSQPVAGTFTYTPSAGTVMGQGPNQTLSVAFAPADAADYAPTSATTTINIGTTRPFITWLAPADITYGTALGPAQLDATANVPGSFTYNPSPGTVLHAGTGQTLSVSFVPQDSTDYTTAAATRSIDVLKATPTLAVSAPGGTYDGSPFPATVTLNGAATLEDVAAVLTYYVGAGTSGTDLGPTPPVQSGTYTVVASFPGSADFAATQSSPISFKIAQATATISLTSLGGSPVYGQSFTFTATVTGAGTPTGSVTFTDGGAVLGTVELDSSGKATLTTSSLAAGSQPIIASYSGSTDFASAASAPTTVAVAKAGTHVVLKTQSVHKKKKVVSLTLDATIAPLASGAVVPTGTVTFELMQKKNKVKVLGTAPLRGGSATLTVKPRSVLKKSVTILYGGDADFQASTSTASVSASGSAALVRLIPTPAFRGPSRDYFKK